MKELASFPAAGGGCGSAPATGHPGQRLSCGTGGGGWRPPLGLVQRRGVSPVRETLLGPASLRSLKDRPASPAFPSALEGCVLLLRNGGALPSVTAPAWRGAAPQRGNRGGSSTSGWPVGTTVSFILLKEGKARLRLRESGFVFSICCFQWKKQRAGERQALLCVASKPCPI